jgi:hypothetical protein
MAALPRDCPRTSELKCFQKDRSTPIINIACSSGEASHASEYDPVEKRDSDAYRRNEWEEEFQGEDEAEYNVAVQLSDVVLQSLARFFPET